MKKRNRASQKEVIEHYKNVRGIEDTMLQMEFFYKMFNLIHECKILQNNAILRYLSALSDNGSLFNIDTLLDEYKSMGQIVLADPGRYYLMFYLNNLNFKDINLKLSKPKSAPTISKLLKPYIKLDDEHFIEIAPIGLGTSEYKKFINVINKLAFMQDIK